MRQLRLDLADLLFGLLDLALERADKILAGPLVELIDQLLAELEQGSRHPLGVFGAVRFGEQRADPALAVALDRDEAQIARIQRFKIVAPEPHAGKARDEVAFRPAQQCPQVDLALEPPRRVARGDVVEHRVGVFRAAGPGAAQQGRDRARRPLARAAHDELDLGGVEVGLDREEVDARDQGRQADNRPEPDVQRPQELEERFGDRARPGAGDRGSLARGGLNAANEIDHDRIPSC